MINDDIGINKFLNDLYEAIDENYAEALENNDELAIVRAKTELDLTVAGTIEKIGWIKYDWITGVKK